MKVLNAQGTLWKAFSTGREAIALLQPMQDSVDALALDGKWQERFARYWSGGTGVSRRGPEGHDIVLMIRLVLAQSVLRKDYRELAALLRDSRGLRQFLEIEYVKDQELPTFQTLAGWIQALPPEFLEAVNVAVVQQQAGQPAGMDLTQWRSDATCVESNIHYPTDSALLRDGLRWMYRWIGRMREELGIRARMNTAELSWEKGHRVYLEIVKLRGGRSRKEQKKIYRRLLKHTERVVGHFQGHLRKGQQTGAFDRMENAVQWARFRTMREEWERLQPLIDQARQQARRRVLKGERIANDDKLLSLWEEHSRVIMRGKQGRPVEFGHKVTIWESREGMLLCGGIYPQGNPAESQIVAAELEQMKSKGLRVESLTVDRGYWNQKTLAQIEAQGTRVYCPKKGKKSAERREQEASDTFRQQQRFRVGIEGSLSVLVRRHALRRARLKGWEGFQRHVHLCVIGMNLLRLLDWKHRQAATLAA
jgi:IS5 family transposase